MLREREKTKRRNKKTIVKNSVWVDAWKFYSVECGYGLTIESHYEKDLLCFCVSEPTKRANPSVAVILMRNFSHFYSCMPTKCTRVLIQGVCLCSSFLHFHSILLLVTLDALMSFWPALFQFYHLLCHGTFMKLSLACTLADFRNISQHLKVVGWHSVCTNKALRSRRKIHWNEK